MKPRDTVCRKYGPCTYGGCCSDCTDMCNDACPPSQLDSCDRLADKGLRPATEKEKHAIKLSAANRPRKQDKQITIKQSPPEEAF